VTEHGDFGEKRSLGIIWAGAGAYALLYFLLGVVRYVTYHSGSDLGLFTQCIATVFRGFHDTPESGSHFTVHFSPILYLCAPLLLATHSPLALVAIQAVAGALAAPPLYLIARKRMPDGLALGVGAVALLYPPLAGVTFTDFHENGFATAATLWLIWAFDARRFALAALFLLLTLGIKEDQGPIVAFAALTGLAFAVRRSDRGQAFFAAGAFVASIATFVFFFAWVRPLAGAVDTWSPTHFYTWSRIVDPRGTAPWYSIGRPAYFLEALVPVAFAALFSPAFVLALPGFAEVLGSHESITYTMGEHYAAVWIPYVLLAFALGIARFSTDSPKTARGFVRASLVLCALVLAVASPTHWGHFLRARNAHDAVLDAALARLPVTLEIGTFDEAYAHLGFDPNAQLGLQKNPRYVLVDETLANSWFTVRYLPLLRSGLARGSYRQVWREDGVSLDERVDGRAAAGAEGQLRGRSSGPLGASPSRRRAFARRRGDE
jgi:uncharacterized membrane protein